MYLLLYLPGLLTEPGSKAMSVSIWGFGKYDREWRVFVLDFEKIIPQSCMYSFNVTTKFT